MISNLLEGFDGVDKLKAMSKQVEYLILFNAIKLLSPIQLLQQYGLSCTNFLFQTITTCFEIVCIDGLEILKKKTCILSIKEGSEGNTRLLPHAKMLLVPINFFP